MIIDGLEFYVKEDFRDRSLSPSSGGYYSVNLIPRKKRKRLGLSIGALLSRFHLKAETESYLHNSVAFSPQENSTD
jgi:hypothetical protein